MRGGVVARPDLDPSAPEEDVPRGSVVSPGRVSGPSVALTPTLPTRRRTVHSLRTPPHTQAFPADRSGPTPTRGEREGWYKTRSPKIISDNYPPPSVILRLGPSLSRFPLSLQNTRSLQRSTTSLLLSLRPIGRRRASAREEADGGTTKVAGRKR